MSVEVQFTGEEVSPALPVVRTRRLRRKWPNKTNARVAFVFVEVEMKRLVEGLEKCSDLVIS